MVYCFPRWEKTAVLKEGVGWGSGRALSVVQKCSDRSLKSTHNSIKKIVTKSYLETLRAVKLPVRMCVNACSTFVESSAEVSMNDKLFCSKTNCKCKQRGKAALLTT